MHGQHHMLLFPVALPSWNQSQIAGIFIVSYTHLVLRDVPAETLTIQEENDPFETWKRTSVDDKFSGKQSFDDDPKWRRLLLPLLVREIALSRFFE